jgi:hypothetical protein
MQDIWRAIDALQRQLDRLLRTERPPRSNTAATTAPGLSDDVTLGYAPGSLWVNTAIATAYCCCDATAGAAVWKQITS